LVINENKNRFIFEEMNIPIEKLTLSDIYTSLKQFDGSHYNIDGLGFAIKNKLVPEIIETKCIHCTGII
jgi:hypothetical protein